MDVFFLGFGAGMVFTGVAIRIAVWLANLDGDEESGEPDKDPYDDYKVGGTA